MDGPLASVWKIISWNLIKFHLNSDIFYFHYFYSLSDWVEFFCTDAENFSFLSWKTTIWAVVALNRPRKFQQMAFAILIFSKGLWQDNLCMKSVSSLDSLLKERIFLGWYIMFTLKTQKMHFLPVFEHMSDSLMAIKVEPHQCPSHQSVLLIKGPIHEIFSKNIENWWFWKTFFESAILIFFFKKTHIFLLHSHENQSKFIW